jgi:hypothetical protein
VRKLSRNFEMVCRLVGQLTPQQYLTDILVEWTIDVLADVLADFHNSPNHSWRLHLTRMGDRTKEFIEMPSM